MHQEIQKREPHRHNLPLPYEIHYAVAGQLQNEKKGKAKKAIENGGVLDSSLNAVISEQIQAIVVASGGKIVTRIGLRQFKDFWCTLCEDGEDEMKKLGAALGIKVPVSDAEDELNKFLTSVDNKIENKFTWMKRKFAKEAAADSRITPPINNNMELAAELNEVQSEDEGKLNRKGLYFVLFFR